LSFQKINQERDGGDHSESRTHSRVTLMKLTSSANVIYNAQILCELFGIFC